MQYEKIYLKEGRPDVYLETYISDSLPNVTRKAILVIPGGGYGGVCADREGEPIALAFMPYETKKEIEILVGGEGCFTVLLDDFHACQAGRYTRTKVYICPEDSGIVLMDSTDDTQSFTINPTGTEIDKISASKGSLKVYVEKKTKQVTGYQIQYAEDANFKTNSKNYKIDNWEIGEDIIKNLTSGKTYYVRVRNVKGSGTGKLVSKWSKVKKVKIKK